MRWRGEGTQPGRWAWRPRKLALSRSLAYPGPEPLRAREVEWTTRSVRGSRKGRSSLPLGRPCALGVASGTRGLSGDSDRVAEGSCHQGKVENATDTCATENFAYFVSSLFFKKKGNVVFLDLLRNLFPVIRFRSPFNKMCFQDSGERRLQRLQYRRDGVINFDLKILV